MTASGGPPVSVVVLTRNEQINIDACLRSLASFEDVHVLDSDSTDATVGLAVAAGAKTAINPFRSFAQQRNWAHERLGLAHDWVLHLDADERMTPELAAEIGRAVAADDGSVGGFYIAEKTLLEGRWLRWAGQYPRYQARLVHRQRTRFVDHGHGQRESSPLPFGTLVHPYLHHAFSHGLEAWLIKHCGYAKREAREILAASEPGGPAAWGDLFSGDRLRRRRAAKRVAMSMPMRPTLRWLHVAVVNLGFLDGRAGLQYARMISVFQQMIDLHMREVRNAPVSPSAADCDTRAASDGRADR